MMSGILVMAGTLVSFLNNLLIRVVVGQVSYSVLSGSQSICDLILKW